MNPAASRTSEASIWSEPTTLGTDETDCPVLIDNVIVVFFATFVPLTVPCDITTPSGTVVEACFTGLYPKPTSFSICFASSSVFPTTFGTTTLSLSLTLSFVLCVLSVCCVVLFSFAGEESPANNLTNTITVITAINDTIPTPIHLNTLSNFSLFSSPISSS